MSQPESLPLLLKQLYLSTIDQHYQQQAEEAEKEIWSYLEFLGRLCHLENLSRHQRRLQRYIKESKLPPAKTLATLDLKAMPSVNAAKIQALADQTDWVKKAYNIIIFGPSGVGKTHLAAALAYRMIEQDIRVLFMPTTMMVQKLQKARADLNLDDFLTRLARIPLLILDDISYVKKSEVETSVLFELIADRYETGSLIITSNQAFSEWGCQPPKISTIEKWKK